MYSRIKIKVILSCLTAVVFFTACDKEVSTSPPEPEPPKGFIYVTSEPYGFQIHLDGRFTGRFTPDSLPFVEETNHDITLKRKFWRDTSVSVVASQENLAEVNINYLQEPTMYGRISFRSQPEGASIIIEDSLLGSQTPYVSDPILPGVYNVRYQYPQHRANSAKVIVESNKTTSVSIALRDTSVWVDYSKLNSGLPTDIITTVAVDNNDVVWVGTGDMGLVKIKGASWQILNVSNSLLPNDYIKRLYSDANGNIWVGTDGGLVKIVNGSIEQVFTTANSIIPNNIIRSIGGDEAGTVWVGTSNGLVRIIGNDFKLFNTENTQLSRAWIKEMGTTNTEFWAVIDTFLVSSNAPEITDIEVFGRKTHNIPNSNPTGIDFDANNNVWVVFAGQSIKFSETYIEKITGGLAVYDGSMWQHVLIGNPSLAINSIYIDSDDTKWVCTDNGLLKFIDLNSSEGFRPNNSGIHSLLINKITEDSKGVYWIATDNGLAKYKRNLVTK